MMPPGWSALAVMPSGAHFLAVATVNRMIAVFDWPYGPGVVGPGGEVDVVEDDRGHQVGGRADGDDPGALRGGQRAAQAQCQGRVPQAVRGELRLPALRGGGGLRLLVPRHSSCAPVPAIAVSSPAAS